MNNSNSNTGALAQAWWSKLTGNEREDYLVKHECLNNDFSFTNTVTNIYLAEHPQETIKEALPDHLVGSKDWAIEAMKTGAKVAHIYFSSHEWITMEGNLTVITEEGYSISSAEFWKYRAGKEWMVDWYIWSSPTPIKEAGSSVEGYTKGEWKIDPFDSTKVMVDTDTLCAYVCSTEFENDHKIGNAQRIVQCVNGWDELQAENKALKEANERLKRIINDVLNTDISDTYHPFTIGDLTHDSIKRAKQEIELNNSINH